MTNIEAAKMLANNPPTSLELDASELSILSNGLPPPEPTFPDRSDSSAAGLKLPVVAVELDVDEGSGKASVGSVLRGREDGGGGMGDWPIMPFDVGRADCELSVWVCESTELVEADMVIVLENLLLAVFGGIAPPPPPPVFGTPGVVVTTATLHSV
jgi:hypothetical protein